jgi:hypothetical protein
MPRCVVREFTLITALAAKAGFLEQAEHDANSVEGSISRRIRNLTRTRILPYKMWC